MCCPLIFPPMSTSLNLPPDALTEIHDGLRHALSLAVTMFDEWTIRPDAIRGYQRALDDGAPDTLVPACQKALRLTVEESRRESCRITDEDHARDIVERLASGLTSLGCRVEL